MQAPAGIYEGRASVRGVATRIGWIVEGDGQVTGNARPAGSPEPQPAPAFDPAAPDAVTLDGVPVSVTAVGGDFAAPSRERAAAGRTRPGTRPPPAPDYPLRRPGPAHRAQPMVPASVPTAGRPGAPAPPPPGRSACSG